MQSDTFLPDTDSDSESDSSGDLPKNNNIGTLFDFTKEAWIGERFIDQSSQEKYQGIRNELFTQATETTRLCFNTNWDAGSGVQYNDTIDIIDQYKLGNVKNIIGFELIQADVMNGATGIAFVDLVIPEIPHKACKINERGISIIARLKTYASEESTHYFGSEPQKSYRNFFTPVSLSKITLELYNPDGISVDTTDYKVFYEFEVTILRQTLSER